MERSEPSLAPEWLKVSSGGSSSSNGSNSSSGNSSLHFGPSSNSDDRGIGASHRNRLTPSASDHDIHRALSFGERTSSSSSRRSTSTNGHLTHGKDNSSHSRSYSFGRTHRDREWNKEPDFHDKERLHTIKIANGYHDHLDSSGTGRKDRGSLQRSQSLTARRQNDSWSKKIGNDTRNGILSTGTSINNNIHKVSFDKDFPSLGSEEKSDYPISRAHSPNLLLMNGPTTASIGGDGFRSLLVDMPAVSVSNGSNLLSARPAPSSPVSTALSSNSSLNMAETLAQAPLRARTTPQISVEAQRLEELALKQSKQLIPVTPKSLVSSMDKSKQKSRTGDIAVLTKAATQVLSQPVNNTSRGVPARSDVLRTPQIGNFQVLNRDKNGVHSTPKEGPNLSNGSGVKNTHGVKAPTVVPSRTSGGLNLKIEAKSGVLSTIQNCLLEKKPSPQAQDRNEFFNALRKKSSGNNSSTNQGLVSATSSASEDSSETTSFRSECQEIPSSGLDQVSPSSVACGNNPDVNCNGFEDTQNDPFVHIDVLEEELALLQALGWKEDEGVQAIAEEEKILFYQMYMAPQSTSGAFKANTVDSRAMLTEGSAASSIISAGSEAEN